MREVRKIGTLNKEATIETLNYKFNKVEFWQSVSVKGIENYSVSTLGRVRNDKTKKILKPYTAKSGYDSVSFCNKKNVKRMLVHRIVAITFIPNPEEKENVNHKNGIKTDNRLVNLEWATQSENISHAWNSGLNKRKISEKHEGQMIEFRKQGLTYMIIANQIGCSDRSVRNKIKEYVEKNPEYDYLLLPASRIRDTAQQPNPLRKEE